MNQKTLMLLQLANNIFTMIIFTQAFYLATLYLKNKEELKEVLDKAESVTNKTQSFLSPIDTFLSKI